MGENKISPFSHIDYFDGGAQLPKAASECPQGLVRDLALDEWSFVPQDSIHFNVDEPRKCTVDILDRQITLVKPEDLRNCPAVMHAIGSGFTHDNQPGFIADLRQLNRVAHLGQFMELEYGEEDNSHFQRLANRYGRTILMGVVTAAYGDIYYSGSPSFEKSAEQLVSQVDDFVGWVQHENKAMVVPHVAARQNYPDRTRPIAPSAPQLETGSIEDAQ